MSGSKGFGWGSKGGGGALATGILQLQGGVPLDATLRNVADQAGTLSPLQLSTTGVGVVQGTIIYKNGERYIHNSGGDLGYEINQNTFMGYKAGNSFTGGGYANTGIGYRSLGSLTGDTSGASTSRSNTAVGYDSAFALVNGVGNTMIGTASGSGMGASAAQNTALGWHAMIYNAGNENVAIGANTLQAVSYTTGSIAIGTTALYSNTATNYDNIAVGRQSMELGVAMGSYNISMGFVSLRNTTGSNNVSIGTYSGTTNTSGSNSVFLGFSAGRYETASNAFYLNNVDQTTLANEKAYAMLYGTFSGTAGSLTGQLLTVNGRLKINTNVSGDLVLLIDNTSATGFGPLVRCGDPSNTTYAFKVANQANTDLWASYTDRTYFSQRVIVGATTVINSSVQRLQVSGGINAVLPTSSAGLVSGDFYTTAGAVMQVA